MSTSRATQSKLETLKKNISKKGEILHNNDLIQVYLVEKEIVIEDIDTTDVKINLK